MDWIDANRVLLAVIALVGLLVSGSFDIWLVKTGRTSISLRTWVIENQHPMIRVAGVALTFTICWLLRDTWPLCCIYGILGGHLFASDI